MQSLIADRKAFFSVLRTEGLSNEIKVNLNYTHTHTSVKQPFVQDYLVEPVPEM